MNKYLHDSGLEISMQESFLFMNHAQCNTAKMIGKLLTERPGVKENAFVVETEKTRDPGGEVQQYVVVTCGDAFFPNGEVFIANPYEVRIPVEQAPGYRYIILKYRAMRRIKGKYSSRYKPDNEYLFVDDMVSLFVRNKAVLAVDGSEMILARFLYSAVMEEPQIVVNRPRYSNAWSISEVMPYDIPSLTQVNQFFHEGYRRFEYMGKYYDQIFFLPKAPLFLQALAVSTPPSYRSFKQIQTLLNTGSKYSVSHFLPIEEDAGIHYHKASLMMGINSRVKFRNVDMYRGTLGEWSDEIITRGGVASSGSIALDLQCDLFVDMDAIWVRPTFTDDIVPGAFVQIWVSSSPSDPVSYPDYEIPARPLASGMPLQFVPVEAGMQEIYITANLVDAQNKILLTEKTSLVPLDSGLPPCNRSFTAHFGMDQYLKGTPATESCLIDDYGHAFEYGIKEILTYKNMSGKKEYIIKAYVSNDAVADTGIAGTVVTSPASAFVLDVDMAAAPGSPYVGSWSAGSLAEAVVLDPGASIKFVADMATVSDHFDFFGTIQLMISREES